MLGGLGLGFWMYVELDMEQHLQFVAGDCIDQQKNCLPLAYVFSLYCDVM